MGGKPEIPLAPDTRRLVPSMLIGKVPPRPCPVAAANALVAAAGIGPPGPAALTVSHAGSEPAGDPNCAGEMPDPESNVTESAVPCTVALLTLGDVST